MANTQQQQVAAWCVKVSKVCKKSAKYGYELELKCESNQ